LPKNLAWAQYPHHLKVQKHEIVQNTFFAKTKTLWSQGLVTRDFFKSYSIRPRYSTFKHFRICSASDEIHSTDAQCAMKFVPHMRSMDVHVKTVLILPLAEHAQKLVPHMLSVR
jgi:hypothetical protein